MQGESVCAYPRSPAFLPPQVGNSAGVFSVAKSGASSIKIAQLDVATQAVIGSNFKSEGGLLPLSCKHKPLPSKHACRVRGLPPPAAQEGKAMRLTACARAPAGASGLAAACSHHGWGVSCAMYPTNPWMLPARCALPPRPAPSRPFPPCPHLAPSDAAAEAADSRNPVAYFYGDAWYGKDTSGGGLQYLTRVRPGEAQRCTASISGLKGISVSGLAGAAHRPASPLPARCGRAWQLGSIRCDLQACGIFLICRSTVLYRSPSKVCQFPSAPVLLPGKVIASWPDAENKAEASIGLKSGDNLGTSYSLDVWGLSRLSAKTAGAQSTAGRAGGGGGGPGGAHGLDGAWGQGCSAASGSWAVQNHTSAEQMPRLQSKSDEPTYLANVYKFAGQQLHM